MPVHHEKEDKTAAIRGSSRNRNVQREDSIDRRPVISQEKPAKVKAAQGKPIEKNKVPSTSTRQKVPSTRENPAAKAKVSSIAKETSGKKPIISKTTPASSRSTVASVKEKPSTSKVAEKSSTKPIIDKKIVSKTSPRTVKTENRKAPQSVENTTSKPKIANSSSLRKSLAAKDMVVLKNKAKEPDKKSVVKDEVKKERSRGHDRTKTRTLSPSEVKVLANTEKREEFENKSHERKKELSKEEANTSQNKEEEERENEKEQENDEGEENDYEDDFEDYESDFEEDSGSEESNFANDVKNATIDSNLVPSTDTTDNRTADEEKSATEASLTNSARKRITMHEAPKDLETERKLDSGSYHLPISYQKREIDEVKNAIMEENITKKYVTVAEADEGFEEEGAKPLVRDISDEFLDFAGAGKREKKRESIQKQRRRGDILSQMITLDAINYTLMEITPVSYDYFMKSFGRSNTSQAHAQTNEDDTEEETQTEDIEFKTKWTQIPTTYTPQVKPDGTTAFEFSQAERLGVGSDGNDKNDEEKKNQPLTPLNAVRLGKFLTSAGQRMRIWLEAQSQHQNSLTDLNQQSSEISCCDGKVPLQLQQNHKTSTAVLIACAKGNNNLVLVVHKSNVVGSSIHICTIFEPSCPLKILTCRYDVQCAGFGPGRGSFVFAGAIDGSINLWDLREGVELHQDVENGSSGRSPTYSTAQVLKNDGHLAPVVSVEILTKDLDDETAGFAPLQVCSMDESGVVIIWSMVQQSGLTLKVPIEDLGLAPWGRVRLVKTSMFRTADLLPVEELSSAGKFSVLQILKPESNEILIGSTSGEVIHCSTKGILLRPCLYKPSKNSRLAAVTCLAAYPFDNRFFLVGCSDGTIRLHKCEQEQPIINLHWNLGDTSPSSAIKKLQWLHSKPCMFFGFDATSRIHIWNLAVSDIYPQLTIPAFANPVTCFGLIRPKRLCQQGYLVIGRSEGNVELHKRKEEFRCKSKEEYKKERKMFQKYVTIL